MKIVITGGTGMLGQAILRDARFAGDEFTILSRHARESEPGKNFRICRWATHGLDGWEKVLEGQDVILHLAGENIGAGRWTEKRKQHILESRVQTGNLLRQAILAMKTPPPVFIQASAVGYYGTRAEDPLDETSQPGSGFLSEVCTAWEKSTAYLTKVGIRRIVLRTGVVLSPQAGILPRLKLPIQAFIGGNLGSGRQYIPWLHIADYVGAVHGLIENTQAEGVYNLCAPHAVPFSHFGKTLAGVLSRPYWLPVPEVALRLLLGEMSALVLDSQNVIPQRLLDMKFPYQYPELEAALRSFA